MAKPRRNQARKTDTHGTADWAAMTHCPACGKKTYYTRKAAKAAAKAHHPGQHMSIYRCRSKSPKRPDPAPWHLGHLAEEVISGEMSKYERYQRGPISQYEPDPQAIDAVKQIAAASKSLR